MAATTGNTGSIAVSGVTECEITNWSATINRSLIEYTTMCLSGANAYLDGVTTVNGSFESLVWLGDIANGSISLTNEVLTIAAADAYFDSIDINTAVGELNTFVYNFTISGPYTITA